MSSLRMTPYVSVFAYTTVRNTQGRFMVSVWLLVIFLNDEPVIPDKPFPEELIFYSQKACEDKREDLLDVLDDDIRCIPGTMEKRVKA